jgi:predicted permease
MNWFHRLFRRDLMEKQLDKELQFHIDQHTADLIERGYPPAEARRTARLEMGGPEQVKELCRDAWGTRGLEDLVQDVRFAIRMLIRRPGFLIVVLLTLALGNGATTVMFTVVNGVLLKPLPYPNPDRLVQIQEQTEQTGDPRWGNLWAFAYPNFLDCKKESSSLDMVAWRYKGGTLSDPGEAEYEDGFQVSAELFDVLGVRLFLGRPFLAAEDRVGASPVMIISYGLWQRRFAGSPGVVGASVVFDDKPCTVVGITPPGFRINGEKADVFTPIGQEPAKNMLNRMSHPGINVLARCRPGISIADAQKDLSFVGRNLAAQYPESNAGRGFLAQPLRPDVGDVQTTLWLLLGAVTLVLLIACVNVASLLLARAVSRERELAMRVALGACRGRLVRQCLTESAVLALLGGGLGVLVAVVGAQPFASMWPGSLPRADEIQLDWRVLVFTLGVSLLSGLLFGLAPALRAPVRDLEQVLRAGARSVAGASRRLHAVFVMSELALAVVLLVAAGLLGRTLLHLSSLDPGLNTQNVLVTRMALSPVVLSKPSQILAAWQDVLDRASRVPGVQSVALVDTVPMRVGDNELGYWPTPAVPPISEQPTALATSVTPQYLQVMGISLLRGRFVDEHDRMGNEPVVVIDQVLARDAFGDQEPVGKQLWMPAMGKDPVRVVGVVRHVRHWGLASDDQARVRAQFYYPLAQVPEPLLRRWSELMSIAVRTSASPLGVLEPLRREVRGARNDQVLYEVRTMDQLLDESLARHRFLLLLFAIFAGLALLLACIGVYGVLAYLTGQRVPEIGVRMALGATARDVIRLILRQSLGMIAVGIGVGTAAALAAGRLLEHLVEGMIAPEPLTFAVTIPVLVVAALLASFLPAWRASGVDPVSALRQD